MKYQKWNIGAPLEEDVAALREAGYPYLMALGGLRYRLSGSQCLALRPQIGYKFPVQTSGDKKHPRFPAIWYFRRAWMGWNFKFPLQKLTRGLVRPPHIVV